MVYSKIIGTGSALPKKVLTNEELEKMVDTTSQWIIDRVGIQSRHIAGENESCTSLAYNASLEAIKVSGVKASDIDLIIVATATPDRVFPGVAGSLQHQLNVGNCPAFDVAAACSGFIYGLSIADQYIKSGAVKTALVVGSEIMSRIVDWEDRATCILFGDGAGAVILSASEKPGIYSTHIHADGKYENLLYAPSPIASPDCDLKDATIRMEGREVFKIAVNTLESIVTETLSANHISRSDIRWLIPHQANFRIIKATAKKLDMSLDQVVITLDKHGNTSAASIPLALDTAVKDGRIKSGDLCLLEAFGAGFTWGSALVEM